MVAKLKNKLKSVEHVALTCDIWTSIVTEGYITATCHFIENDELKDVTLETRNIRTAHTGENINIVLQSIEERWDIKDKIEAIVTDNAKNMTNGVKYSDNNSLRCTAHTLQLTINDALEDSVKIKNIIDKCKSIVAHFKKSSKSLDKLRAIQKRLDLKVLKFVQSVKNKSVIKNFLFSSIFLFKVPTRWNSMYYMLERLYEQKMAIKTFFNDSEDTSIEELNNAEWEIIDELINVLSPLEQATKYMSGDKYCSMSLIVAVMSGLVVKLKLLKILNLSIKTFRDKILNSLQTRFESIEDNEFATISSILDPRIKDTCFLSSEKKRNAMQNILNKLKELQDSNLIFDKRSELVEEEEPKNKRPKFDLWQFVNEQQDGILPSVAAELDSYLKVNIFVI